MTNAMHVKTSATPAIRYDQPSRMQNGRLELAVALSGGFGRTLTRESASSSIISKGWSGLVWCRCNALDVGSKMDLIVPRRPVYVGGGVVGRLYGGGGLFPSYERWTICSMVGWASSGMRLTGRSGKRVVQSAIVRWNAMVFGWITDGGVWRER
jgi:hypothetical protein